MLPTLTRVSRTQRRVDLLMAEQKLPKTDFIRSLKICSAVIYFMTRVVSLNMKKDFGQQGIPVSPIWPVGRKGGVAYLNGKRGV